MTKITLAGILAILAAAGCSSEERDGAPQALGRMPTVLSQLVLARDSDEITPVEFPHARHMDADFAGRALSCADCHHPLSDRPRDVPAACGACHPHEATEGGPPDI